MPLSRLQKSDGRSAVTNRPRYPFIASNNDRCQGLLGVLPKGISGKRVVGRPAMTPVAMWKQPPRRVSSGRLAFMQSGGKPVLRGAVSGFSFPLARQSDFLPCELGFEVQASAARLLHIAILIPSAAVASIALHITPLHFSGSPPVVALRHADLLTSCYECGQGSLRAH